jgi:hypothetical protein
LKPDLLKRRQKMLELHGQGFSLLETVQALEEEFNVTRRTLYDDWRKRSEWAPSLMELGDSKTFFLELLNSHREISRMAVMEYLKGDNSSARIGALRLLRDLNLDFVEMITLKDTRERVAAMEAKMIKGSVLIGH